MFFAWAGFRNETDTHEINQLVRYVTEAKYPLRLYDAANC